MIERYKRKLGKTALVAMLASAVTLCGPTSASADGSSLYPARTIKVVVPFPPGGSADIVARVIAKPLTEMLGQPVLVDNRPGADGAIAAESVAQAAPDGYTLFMATYGAMSAVPTLHSKPGYDAVADFTPITSTGKFAFFLFAHPGVPARTLHDLIAYVHAHPGQLNYGSGNAGSIVAMAELAAMADLDMTHVPYRGEVPAMNDFLAGRVQLMFATPTNALPWVRQGKLNALVTLLDRRSALLPDVPTMAEAGMPDLAIVPWAGLFGPAKMSRQVTGQLSAAVNTILRRESVRAALAHEGFEPKGSRPEELAAYVKEQLKVWSGAIHTAGIKPE